MCWASGLEKGVQKGGPGPKDWSSEGVRGLRTGVLRGLSTNSSPEGVEAPDWSSEGVGGLRTGVDWSSEGVPGLRTGVLRAGPLQDWSSESIQGVRTRVLRQSQEVLSLQVPTSMTHATCTLV